MKYLRILSLIVVAVCLSNSKYFAQGAQLPTLFIKHYQLKNGLTVVMHEDHSVPIVSVQIWYHVAPKMKGQAEPVSLTFLNA